MICTDSRLLALICGFIFSGGRVSVMTVAERRRVFPCRRRPKRPYPSESVPKGRSANFRDGVESAASMVIVYNSRPAFCDTDALPLRAMEQSSNYLTICTAYRKMAQEKKVSRESKCSSSAATVRTQRRSDERRNFPNRLVTLGSMPATSNYATLLNAPSQSCANWFVNWALGPDSRY
jgi:hypothetical protein